MDFRTARLTAERLSPGHLEDLTALHRDPEVMRHLGGVRSPAETAAYLQANLDHWDQHGFGLWVVRTADGQFAGRVGVRRIEVEGVDEVEVAYTFRRDLWGQGLATESACALVALWRGTGVSPSLVGLASVDNLGSRKVLLKSGLGYERDALYHGAAVALYRLAR
jgi:RimJ/RimL family protein N-acetyltransferase